MKKFMPAFLAALMVLAMIAPAFAAGNLTKNEAVNKALKNAKLSRSKVYALETETKAKKYEIEFIKKSNGAEYEYEISKSGTILKKSIEYKYKYNGSRSKIGKTAARKKVAKYTGVKLSTVKKGSCVYEYDYGEGIYEIKFRKGHYKYDCEVLAPTGKIIDFERKYVK